MTDPVTPVNLQMLDETDTYFNGLVTDAAGAAVDLTLASTVLRFIIRRTMGDAAALLTKAIGTGVTVAADGTYTVKIENTDSTLTPGLYYYSLEYTAPAGDVDVVARGKLEVYANAAVA